MIPKLNALLADELTAIHQYSLHAEMDENWGYGQLHDAVMKRAKMEMRHASRLMSRILSLGGVPVVSRLNAIQTGQDVPKQFQMDRLMELAAIAAYKEAAVGADDMTCLLLGLNLKDEKDHLNWLDSQLALIDKMGVNAYLSTMV